MNERHWHIAGLGSIGSLVSANLIMANTLPIAIKRHDNSRPATQFKTLTNQLIALPEAKLLSQCGEITNLFVPLKSYDVMPFLQQVKPQLAQKANIVLCHNGMGTIEKALSILPASVNLYFCTTNNGVYREENKAMHAGQGASFWKIIHEGNEQQLTQKDFDLLLPSSSESSDLNTIIWQKLLINCVINPLTTIHQVANGQLADQQYQSTINKIIDEVCHVAKCESVQLDKNEMSYKVSEVIKQTANNTSSMRQDMLLGKTTEIEFINGYIIQCARKHNIAVPINTYLHKEIVERQTTHFE